MPTLSATTTTTAQATTTTTRINMATTSIAISNVYKQNMNTAKVTTETMISTRNMGCDSTNVWWGGGGGC